MRLIDADALKEVLKDPPLYASLGGMTMEDVFMLIDNEAPTIDAVPVVRCKACKWWTKQEKSIQGRCALNGTYPTGGWYCANGERKDDE